MAQVWQWDEGADIPPGEDRETWRGFGQKGKLIGLKSPLPLGFLGHGDSLYTYQGPGNG